MHGDCPWVDDVGAAAAGSGSPGIKSALGTAGQKEPASRDIAATEFTDAEPLPMTGNRFPFHLGLFEAGFFHSSQMKEPSVCPLRASRPSVINKPPGRISTACKRRLPFCGLPLAKAAWVSEACSPKQFITVTHQVRDGDPPVWGLVHQPVPSFL